MGRLDPSLPVWGFRKTPPGMGSPQVISSGNSESLRQVSAWAHWRGCWVVLEHFGLLGYVVRCTLLHPVPLLPRLLVWFELSRRPFGVEEHVRGAAALGHGFSFPFCLQLSPRKVVILRAPWLSFLRSVSRVPPPAGRDVSTPRNWKGHLAQAHRGQRRKWAGHHAMKRRAPTRKLLFLRRVPEQVSFCAPSFGRGTMGRRRLPAGLLSATCLSRTSVELNFTSCIFVVFRSSRTSVLCTYRAHGAGRS